MALEAIVNSGRFKNGLVYFIILVAVLAILIDRISSVEQWPAVPIDRVAGYIKAGQVEKILVEEDRLEVVLKPGQSQERVISQKEHNVGLGETLKSFGVTEEQYASVEIDVRPPNPIDWVGLLSTFFPIIVFGVILLFMVRQAQSGNNQAISFGKSRARLWFLLECVIHAIPLCWLLDSSARILGR